jgi:glutamine amidotransferase
MNDFDGKMDVADVAVVDIGISNIASVTNSLVELGYAPSVVNNPMEIGNTQRVILPGNGSFRIASERLTESGWFKILRDFAKSKKPLLGICLGMHLLATFGEEDGISEGLGLIPGVSRRLPAGELRLPHVGWNTVEQVKSHFVFEGIKNGRDFYFSHSFALEPSARDSIFGTTHYGDTFVSVVGSQNVVGVQFHPEKSQKNGLKLLSQFMKWDGTA